MRGTLWALEPCREPPTSVIYINAWLRGYCVCGMYACSVQILQVETFKASRPLGQDMKFPHLIWCHPFDQLTLQSVDFSYCAAWTTSWFNLPAMPTSVQTSFPCRKQSRGFAKGLLEAVNHWVPRTADLVRASYCPAIGRCSSSEMGPRYRDLSN